MEQKVFSGLSGAVGRIAGVDPKISCSFWLLKALRLFAEEGRTRSAVLGLRLTMVVYAMMRHQKKSIAIDEVMTKVIALARHYLSATRVIVFGSRARGDFRERSDYDFAIEWSGTPDRWGEFAVESREQAPTLCEIDLVNLRDNLDPDFRDRIEKEGVVILG